MRLITVTFSSRSEFLLAFAENQGRASLFYATKRSDLQSGEDVMVEMSFPELPNPIICRANIGEIASGAGATLWLWPKDRTAYDFASSVARGDIEPRQAAPRRAGRFPAELPVDCRIEAEVPKWMASETVDLSSTGAFIRSREQPPVGTRVRLVIGPTRDTAESFVVYGHVAWARSGGFAVRFEARGHGDARRLRALMRQGAERGQLNISA